MAQIDKKRPKHLDLLFASVWVGFIACYSNITRITSSVFRGVVVLSNPIVRR